MFTEEWVCVMRPDHALAGTRLPLDRYASMNHLLINPAGEPRGWIDGLLAERGRTRHVAFTRD